MSWPNQMFFSTTIVATKLVSKLSTSFFIATAQSTASFIVRSSCHTTPFTLSSLPLLLSSLFVFYSSLFFIQHNQLENKAEVLSKPEKCFTPANRFSWRASVQMIFAFFFITSTVWNTSSFAARLKRSCSSVSAFYWNLL